MRAAGQGGARPGAALYREDDRVEPGTGHAADCRYAASDRIQPTVYRRRRFPQRFTPADIEMLASVDEAHETLRGAATRRILEREVELYGKQEYARLATISVAHLYNLRHSPRYRERAIALRQNPACDGGHWRAQEA